MIVQTWFAPKQIVPLAYDSGGVTTSTVTVPLVAALGLGLAETAYQSAAAYAKENNITPRTCS